MNFPMEYPLFQFLYALLNTSGWGGIVVGIMGGGSILAYTLTLRWIANASQADEVETFAYPTPALYHTGDKTDQHG
jgi:hypothetical protein